MAGTRVNPMNAVIDAADKIFYEATYDALNDVVIRKARNAQDMAVKEGRKFFKLLTGRGYMGVKAPGPYGWADLSDKWKQRKKKHRPYAAERIYLGIRPELGKDQMNLRDYMRKKNANILFGTPRVKIKAATDTSDIENPKVTFDSSLNRWRFSEGRLRSTGRSVRGRFVTPSARVTVELFRKIRGLSGPEIFDAMRRKSRDLGAFAGISDDGEGEEGEGDSGSNWIQRLAGNEFGTALRGRVPSRPLLTPFMNWWLDSYMYSKVEKELSL